MEAERWRRIEELCQAALEQPPAKRAVFLTHACSDDAQLRAEVQALLDQQADSFLESAPVSAIKALSTGARLGNFEVVELLGRGGMGEVWRARDARLKRDVAIKVLPPGLARDPDRITRFEREARAASALNHPNIVCIHDIGCDKGTYWIASELVRGDTLRRMIEAGPLPAPKAIEIAVQVAAGLAAAHAAGLVHRDLKPDNIMVTRDGHVKILDFGLAKQRRTTQDSTTTDLTDEGVVLGTAGYMSPEQVRGQPADHRSDLFSFGVVLYEMLCGNRAFAGDSSVEVMSAILKQEPPELPATVPPALERIVRRCLEKDPERRFQNAADLGFALGIPASLAVAPTHTRRTWPAWAAAGAMCLATAIAAYLWVSRSGPAEKAENASFRRLTNDSGLTTDAAISNDGKLVVYASDRENATNLDIYVQQVDGSGVVRITNDPADDYDPDFSPDGTAIGFRSDRGGGGIFLAPAIGGEARLLVPEGRRPRFSPDGQRLLYWTGPAEPHDVRGSADTKLWVRPISGGEATQIGPGCRVFERTPVWSPDGSRILFIGTCGSDLRMTYQPQNYGITAWVATIDGKDLKRNRELYNLWPSIHDSPVADQWIANPSRLLIPISVGDATSITAVPVSADGTRITGPPQRQMFAGGTAARVCAAANGRLVLSTGTSEPHIWTLAIDGNGSATGAPQQVTHGPAGEYFPVLSTDGEKLAFLSNRANGKRLFYKDLTNGREKELSTEGYRYDTPVFNYDGTKIMCVQYPKAESWRNVIFEVPIAGGISRKVWDKTVFSWLWDWSPDNSNLLLIGGNEMDLASLATSRFLADDAEEQDVGRFSHDGRWVTFLSFPRRNYFAKPLRSNVFVAPFRKTVVPKVQWIRVTDGGSDFSPHFSCDDRLIFFTSERDGFRCIWAQKLAPDMHSIGKPFAAYHSHERKRPLVGFAELAVGPHAIVFNRTDLAGNIWLVDPEKTGRQ